MARPSNTAERKRQIVDAMLVLVAERGYDGASVAEIAKTAGLAPGLVHYHFANKQAVLIALFERLVYAVDARYVELAERAGDDPRARLAAFVDAHLALGPKADPRAVSAWVALGVEALRTPEVRALYEDVVASKLELLRGLFRAALLAEGRETRAARAMAAGTLAAIEGTFRLAATAPEAFPRGTAAATVRRMVEGLLAGEAR